MKQIYKDSFQKKAINLEMGPAMILAGPGSGKTFIITHRIQHLIQDCKISPSQIMVITFTRAAANEMKARFSKLNPLASNNITFGTFHSVFFNFLRSFSNNTPKIIEPNIKDRLIKQLIDCDDKSFEDVESLSLNISKYKNNAFSFDRTFAMNSEEKETFLSLFDSYQKTLKELNYIDYDDILINFKNMLSDKEISDSIKTKYKAILVDEFQDINEVQYSILKMIVPYNKNIFVVGDDDQSIYGFRGAKPQLMERFCKEFDNVNVVELKYNYRSSADIIDSAQKLISYNLGRMKRTDQIAIKAKKSVDDNLFSIMVMDSKTEHDSFICAYSKTLKADETLGILTRTNKDCDYYKRLIRNALQHGHSDEDLYGVIINDLYYYLLSAISSKREAYIKILNRPQRFIAKSVLQEETVDLKEISRRTLGTVYGNSIQIFERQMLILKRALPLTFTKYLFDFMGYGQFVKELYPDKRDVIDSIIDKIQKEAAGFSNKEDYLKNLEAIIESGMNTQNKKDVTNIAVATYHSSKGLEFDHVLLPDICEGNVPGRISLKDDNLDEERRLFYVAMTRAKEKLIILTIKNEENTSVLPSRFISEIES